MKLLARYFPTILLFTALCCLASCGNKEGAAVATDGPDANGNLPSGKPRPAATAAAQPAAGPVQLYKGRINNIPVTFKLTIKDGQISGSYLYDKIGKDITLKGTLDKSDKLKMEEFGDGAEKPATATFTGTMSDADGPVTYLEGDWAKRGSKEPTSFYLNALNVYDGIQVATKVINDKAKNYEVESVYPQFSGGNSPHLSKFNDLIRTELEKGAKDFKTDLEGENNSLSGSYNIPFINNELASVCYSGYTYTGGAHGTPGDIAFNYDLKNGRELELADLFKPGADYLKPISDYCISEIKKREYFKDDPKTVEEGAAPEKENYINWYVSRKGLVIGFGAYQVGPYAAGTPYVTIPFSTLKDVLKPDGPVSAATK